MTNKCNGAGQSMLSCLYIFHHAELFIRKFEDQFLKINTNIMKKYLLLFLIIAINVFSTKVFAQSSSDTTLLGLPGDNLDLYAVLELFQKSKTIEDFEKTLNEEKTGINNLDLNLDKKVDFIKVTTKQKDKDFTFILQVDVTEKEVQDVAVILVSKDKNDKVSLQIVGDKDLYGKDYVIEPKPAATANPAYGGTDPIAVASTPTTVVVQSAPIVQYVYSPAYVPYYPPYYYGYYPPYFAAFTVMAIGVYHHNNYYHHAGYHGGYGNNTVVIHNTNNYNNYNNSRNTSNTVNNNKSSGNYGTNRASSSQTKGSSASTRQSASPSANPSKGSASTNNRPSASPSTSPSKASSSSSRPSASPSAQPSRSSNSSSARPSSSSGSRSGSGGFSGGGRGGGGRRR